MVRLHRVFLSVAVLAAAVSGQAILSAAVVPVAVASAVQSNPGTMPLTAWSGTVFVPGVAAMRLKFDVARLAGADDAIVVTNPLDGQIQRLDPEHLAQWNDTSGWFNGNTLTASLELGPFSSGAVSVGSATVQVAPLIPETICFSDDRAPVLDLRMFRLVIGTNQGTNLCTGFAVGGGLAFVSAGHCFAGFTGLSVVAETNVPPSTSAGILVHPAIVDQFPADEASFVVNAGGPGHDWAVGRLHPNSAGVPVGQLVSGTLFPTNGFGGAILVTSFGADSTPNLTRNYVEQVSAGTATLGTPGSNILLHDADTDSGSDGAPVFTVTSLGNFVAGIHTGGGCTQSGGTNTATSTSDPAFQAALTSVRGCGDLQLLDGPSHQVGCATPNYFLTPVQARWNVVGVSSPSNWDIRFEGISSALGGSACDFLVADGHAGLVPTTSGPLNRVSGTSPAQVQFQSATVVPVGQTLSLPWASTDILVPYEFQVTAAGQHTINLFGDPSLSWLLFAPGSGSSWSARSSAIAVGGIAGGGPVTTPSLTPGVYCLVVFRDGGPAAVSPSTITLNVCPTQPTINLQPGIPQPINGECQAFTFTPTPSIWTGVALAASSDWSLSVSVNVGVNPAPLTEFAVGNGHLGTVIPQSGVMVRMGGPGPATAELVTATSLGSGAYTSTTLPAGHVMRLFEVTTTVAFNYEITVTGDPALKWFYCTRANAGLFGRTQVQISGDVGDNGASVAVGPGTFAIAIVYDGPVAAVDLPFALRVGSAASHLTLSGPGASVAVSNSTQSSFSFTSAPAAARWNAVGVDGGFSLVGGWGISMGPASSASSFASVLLSNGRLGFINPVNGIIQTGTALSAGGALREANITTFNVGPTSGTATFSPFPLFHLFEFQVTTAGLYDITVTGPTTHNWSLFRPGTSAVWRSRSAADLTAPFGTQSGVALQPGWHAILVTRASGTFGGSTTTTATVTPALQPLPVLTSITPPTAVAGSADTQLTLAGSGFNAFSTVQWDSATSLAVSSVSASTIVVTVPASLLAAPGAHTLRVFNPLPAGGTSAAQSFDVTAPVPSIAALSPTTAVAGGPAFTLAVTVSAGTPVFSGSLVNWNGTPLPTALVDATHLTASVSAADLSAAGIASITVTATLPGGGTSSAAMLPIVPPHIIAISPASLPLMTPASPLVTVTVTGTGFHPGSFVRSGAIALPTTFVTATQLTCGVGPSIPETLAPGGVSFTVENAHLVVSNTTAALVAPGRANDGTVIRFPMAPAAAEAFGLRIEGGKPGVPFVLLADLAPPAPIAQWPTPAANLLLGVGFGATTIPLIDGIGIFGPANSAAVLGIAPSSLPPRGQFTLNGFTRPSAPLGVSFTLQAAYLDPTAPAGFVLGWPRLERL